MGHYTDDRPSYEGLQMGPPPPPNSPSVVDTSVDGSVDTGSVDAYMECIRQKEGLKKHRRRPSDGTSVLSSNAKSDPCVSPRSRASSHYTDDRPSYEGLQVGPPPPQNSPSVVDTSVDGSVDTGSVDAYTECIRQKESRTNYEGLKQQSRRPSETPS